MTTIRTVQNDIINLELELGESAIVQFKPDGANAVPRSKIVSFMIGALSLPNGRMALSVSFPEDDMYWEKLGDWKKSSTQVVRFVLLDDENEPERMTLVLAGRESELELERFSSRSLTSGFFHKG